jgi:hypothetical protein
VENPDCACSSASPVPSTILAPVGSARRGKTAPGLARHLSLVPAIALVLLPKCPLCVAAYLGVLGSLGTSSWLRATWGLPLGAGLLAFTFGALLVRAHRSTDYRPPLLALAGSALLLAGKFVIDARTLVAVGALLLVGASLWSVRRVATGASP